MWKRLALTLVGVVALVGVSAAPPVFAASRAPSVMTPGPAPGFSSANIHEAPDYFTERWNDPMDMSNWEDFDGTPGRRAVGVNAGIHDGVLDYTSTDGFGRLYLVNASPNELKVTQHRQATHVPIDAGRMSRMSFRAWTDRNSTGLIVWDHCGGNPGNNCQGSKAFNLRAGWHTYDLDLLGANDRDSDTAWGSGSIDGAPYNAGNVVQLALQPSLQGVPGVHGLVDWVRVYQPGNALVTVNNNGFGTRNLWHDDNTSTTDNGSAGNQGAGAGVLHVLPQGSPVVDLGALPAGGHHFELESNNSFTPASGVVNLNPRPRPVVIEPDVTGDGDWYVATRGPAMNFENGADPFTMFDGGSSVRNANAGASGGWLHATSAGAYNDPQMFLTDAFWHGPLLDAAEWHRVTWRIQYDGTWGTNGTPGQGMDARFCWFPANQSPSCSKDLFPAMGPLTYSVDLKTDNPADIESAGYPGTGFGGPNSRWVHLLRLDPHEDPGFRPWHVDDVRISHDDRVPFGGPFAIRFRDDAYEPGSTARVFIDDNDNWFDGASGLSRQALQPGENVVQWDGRVGAGRYWVHVIIDDPAGGSSISTSTGPVDVPDPGFWSPFGTFEGVIGARGKMVVNGFAVDPDWISGPVGIHVYVDDQFFDLGPADQAHHGIAMMRTDAGPWHGFSREIGAAPGLHNVCVYAINNGYGDNAGLGCRGVIVK